MPECGESNSVPFDVLCTGGVPTITSFSPSGVTAGSGAFTLTVNGTNFRPDSVVQWNGSNRVTTYVSSIKLTVAILAGDVAAVGIFSVVVINPPPGCGPSIPAPFQVIAVSCLTTPAITSLDPAAVVGGGPSFTLTIHGTDFTVDSVVYVNGMARTTTFVSNTELQVSILDSEITCPA